MNRWTDTSAKLALCRVGVRSPPASSLYVAPVEVSYSGYELGVMVYFDYARCKSATMTMAISVVEGLGSILAH